MKKKFEANVAAEMPKTRLHEPALPWKLNEDDVGVSAPKDDDMRAIKSGTPPLKTRPAFLIMLVLAIFALGAYMLWDAISENNRIRRSAAKSESEVSLMRTSLAKAIAEKQSVSDDSSQLKQKISDLTAQKELFTSVIESLTKKGDDSDVQAKEPAAPPSMVVS